MADDPICPFCGRPVGTAESTGLGPWCTPISCPMWTTTGVYDHDTRTWVPANPQEAP